MVHALPSKLTLDQWLEAGISKSTDNILLPSQLCWFGIRKIIQLVKKLSDHAGMVICLE